MSKKIGVVGSGGFGTALAILLQSSGYDVVMWSYLKEEAENLEKFKENKPFLPGVGIPDGIRFTNELKETADGSDLIVMVTPSKATRQTARNLSPYVSDGQLIVNASKGLDPETLKRLSVVIKEEIPQSEVAVISGPSHAEEVARKIPTTNVIAARTIAISEKIQDIFMNSFFRVYTSTDMAGVELGGALKNVIALCAGVLDGLGMGDNTKAALMVRGMVEIARLGKALGADTSTFSGLSGMGDLIVTCTSMHSRNRRAGILIGQGKSAAEAMDEVKMTVEGVYTAKAAYALAKQMKVEMPICEKAYQVLFENYPVKNVVPALMSRERKHEMEETAF